MSLFIALFIDIFINITIGNIFGHKNIDIFSERKTKMSGSGLKKKEQTAGLVPYIYSLHFLDLCSQTTGHMLHSMYGEHMVPKKCEKD